MLVHVNGATLDGFRGVPVSVEVDASRGLPAFQIVGQGDRVIRESRDRIRSAFRHSGLEFPPGRVTVNLAPTELPKTGPSLDLPIAVGIAATRITIPEAKLARTLLIGELGLDGSLRTLRGTLALLEAGEVAGLTEAIAPSANLGEAEMCPVIQTQGATSLVSAVRHLAHGEPLTAGPEQTDAPVVPPELEPELTDVRGQEFAKRALEIAAAGGHNLLLVGPPGSGKTLLARRLSGLLPDLRLPEAIEATRIHGIAGTLGGRLLLRRPPFRSPHHTVSEAGLTGGGKPLRPGEISLAHRGVLFLDELPEFRRSVLEALRQPLEEGVIHLARAQGPLDLPARFQFVGAMNPCPCGFQGTAARECHCEVHQIRRYRDKLSGPLLDRIDLHVPVPPVAWNQIHGSEAPGETTAQVRERVVQAHRIQENRFSLTPYTRNAELSGHAIEQCCALSRNAESLLERSITKLGLSMRAYVRTLRVARTIADLDGDQALASKHVAEALALRFEQKIE